MFEDLALNSFEKRSIENHNVLQFSSHFSSISMSESRHKSTLGTSENLQIDFSKRFWSRVIQNVRDIADLRGLGYRVDSRSCPKSSVFGMLNVCSSEVMPYSWAIRLDEHSVKHASERAVECR